MAAAALPLRELKTRIPGQDEPAYCRPMTLADHDKIGAVSAAQAGTGEVTQGLTLAVTVIHKVCDAEGNKLFTHGDKTLLMERVDNRVIVDLVNEIAEPMSLEDAEGN